ncbi:NAD-dependent epimerase/dehydratase family protein [Legionella saoudiensis]|uniref:NAD-dependent epimerase/dehydratase family protein n=1 Tax=Legionella saoudiensis TaxID=1750561 RepID=UPI0007303F55|nr:NAD-dependent epimerase/dehydratase family protein [Legionella saoudiensis]
MGRYLVTGGAGFLGSHLVDDLIKTGHEVTVIDDFSTGSYEHPQARTIKTNILNEEQVRPYFQNIEGCFHLIGIPSVIMTMEDWFHFHATNMKGSLVVFKLAIEAGNIPVVYTSSCAVYGETPQLPLKENQLVKPLSSYGCDKLAVELNAYALGKNYQLPTLGLRLFNLYGPRQSPTSLYSGVITKFINALKSNSSPVIFGDGEQTRDFIFVNDVVNALVKAMNKVSADGEVVNICTGKGISISQLALEITKLMGKNINPTHAPKRSYDIMHSLGSVEKMHAFGFEATSKFSEGLQETIDFFLTK